MRCHTCEKWQISVICVTCDCDEARGQNGNVHAVTVNTRPGMHNFFEAKGRNSKTLGPQGWERRWGFGEGTVSPSPPAARRSGERCKLPQWGPGPVLSNIRERVLVSSSHGRFWDKLTVRVVTVWQVEDPAYSWFTIDNYRIDRRFDPINFRPPYNWIADVNLNTIFKPCLFDKCFKGVFHFNSHIQMTYNCHSLL